MPVETTLDSSDLLTREQLAQKVGISLRTLDTWVAHKVIPCIRIGDILRFDWQRVKHAMITTCEAPAAATKPCLPGHKSHKYHPRKVKPTTEASASVPAE